MIFETLVSLKDEVLSFCIDEECIYALSNNSILKIDIKSGSVVLEKKLFEKYGKARLCKEFGNFITVSNFCQLLLLSKKDLSVLHKWTLGNDSSSDICGLTMDGKNAYVSIRNGGICRLSLISYDFETFKICESSSWFPVLYKSFLLFGSTSGELFLINKDNMVVLQSLKIGKMNLRSLYVYNDFLFVASQDKTLYVIDLNTFSLVNKIKHIHDYMFDIISVENRLIYTVSHPASELKIVDINGDVKETISKHLRLSGSATLKDNKIYICSRSFAGIDVGTL